MTEAEAAESGYRRGCHQTASRIYMALISGKDEEWVGILEDVLGEMRTDRKPYAGYLDVAMQKVRDRSKVPAAVRREALG